MQVERHSGTVVSFPFNHHKVFALLYNLASHKEHLEQKPVILRLHGTLGNLLDETEHDLPMVLAKAGYSSMTMNTLLANLGLFFGFGIFENVIPQIDAACDLLRKVGFRKIVIAGHGLGGCMAIRYAALRNDRARYHDIVGAIAIATPYSLPETVRKKWKRFKSEPSYNEMHERAKRIFKPNTGEKPAPDEIVLVRKAHGNSYLPQDTEIYTLKTWWALASPEAEGTKNYKNIGKIKIPLFLIYGLQDDIIEYSEFGTLAKIAKDSGNQDVSQFTLEADHRIEGKHNELGSAIIRWLDERFKES